MTLVLGLQRFGNKCVREFCDNTRIQLREDGKLVDQSTYHFPGAIILKEIVFPYSKFGGFRLDKLTRVIYVHRFPLVMARKYIRRTDKYVINERYRIPVRMKVLILRSNHWKFLPVDQIADKKASEIVIPFVLSREPMEKCIYNIEEGCWIGTGEYYHSVRRKTEIPVE